MSIEKISVVVCVKNEETRIKECLDRIVLNKPDEIIVVDGNSTDNTAIIAKQYTDKVIISHNSNLTRDRQIGIDAAQNNYIAMIDGDHRLKEGDLSALLLDLHNFGFDIVQAQLKSYQNNNWTNKGEEEMWEINHNIPGPKKMIGVAPAIYRKSLFQHVQFDDTITKTIDDTDFIYRLSLIPGIKYGIGNTVILQYHTASYQDYLRKFKWYGIGDGEFCIKHKNRASSMWFHLLIRYPIIYSVKALTRGKIYAAWYCVVQGIVRAKWMIITSVIKAKKVVKENNICIKK